MTLPEPIFETKLTLHRNLNMKIHSLTDGRIVYTKGDSHSLFIIDKLGVERKVKH